nr:GFA family protein [uncultured Sphingomonas sp.]
MSDTAAPTGKSVEGGCRCGRVRFRVTGDALVTMACHCTGCQRMTASAYSLSGLYPAEGFAVIAGEPVIGGLHGATRHFHCDHCKSWLFTRPEGLDAFVNIRTTMLDAPMSAPPLFETWTEEALPWAATGASYSYPKFPPPESFGTLMQAYAESLASG